VDIGIGLPNTVPGTEGRTLVDWAKNAEEAGFSTLGTIGRLVYPNYEELIALSAAAAVTSRIRLTTSVLLAPLYANTALFAKQAASLDRLSGGRLVLGLGLGGREDDYTASALPTAGKGRRLDEQLVTALQAVPGGQAHHVGELVVAAGQPLGVAGQVGHVQRDTRDDLADDRGEDRVEQAVLAPEVVVDLRLVAARLRRDAVDAGAGDAVGGELGGRGVEDAALGRLGVAFLGGCGWGRHPSMLQAAHNQPSG